MNRWIWIALAGAVFLAVCAVALGPRAVTVGAGQQAVVERDGGAEVLDAGLHIVGAFAGQVTVYDVFFERLHRIEAAVVADACPVAVELVYNVGDVIAFHESGGDFGAIGGLDAEVRQSLAGMEVRLDAPLGDVATALRADVSGAVPEGLEILRVNMDPGPCAPEPPRVVMQRGERIALENIGALGAERVPLGEVALVSGDDGRFDLERAVATYDVVDAARVRACFGDTPDLVANVVGNVVQQSVRMGVGTGMSRDIAATLGALDEADPGGRIAQMRDDCGLRIGGLDLSEAALWPVVHVVDCGETPDAAVCLE